jgi:predicted lipoprotein with Yx(FWY)xxD motif
MAMMLVLSACGGESQEGAADEAQGATVRIATGEPGTFLVDADGMSLYLFTNDSPGVSTCGAGCIEAWPALLTAGEPVAGDGVDAALLGTTTREDGAVQVTYGGWPLYFFAGDAAAGDVTGQGVNDVWFVVAPDGAMVGGTASDGPDTSMGSGYGYGSGAETDGY